MCVELTEALSVLVKKINRKRPSGRLCERWIDRRVKDLNEVDDGITMEMA